MVWLSPLGNLNRNLPKGYVGFCSELPQLHCFFKCKSHMLLKDFANILNIVAWLQGSLLYNEYIVYNVEQIRMRYVLHVSFNFKRRQMLFASWKTARIHQQNMLFCWGSRLPALLWLMSSVLCTYEPSQSVVHVVYLLFIGLFDVLKFQKTCFMCLNLMMHIALRCFRTTIPRINGNIF